MIDNGADIHAEGASGWTPLHWAALYNARETVALLIDKGAEVNAKNKDRLIPLDYATEENARKDLRIAVKEETRIAERAAKEDAEEIARNCMHNGESEPSDEAIKRVVLADSKELFRNTVLPIVSCWVENIASLKIVKKGKHNQEKGYWPYIIKAKIQISCEKISAFFGVQKGSYTKIVEAKIRLHVDDFNDCRVTRTISKVL